MMDYKHILTETQNQVGIITINRPEVMNAINESTLYEIAHQLSIFDTDPNIAAVVIKGSDSAFAAGIDIPDLNEKINKGGFILSEHYKSFGLIEGFRKPLIAAISGYALGIGFSLAMCCDIILAAENAHFGFPEISLGLIPGFGTTQKLVATVGKAKASEIIMTGRAINAEEARESGLISRIVPLIDLTTEAIRTATQIANFPKMAIEKAKESIKDPQQKIFESGNDCENRNIQYCLSTSDFRESVAAFIEKREPNYKNT